MLRIDPQTGEFYISTIEKPLMPRMLYSAFRRHPAAAVLTERKKFRRGSYREYDLPEGKFQDCQIVGRLSINRYRIEALWLQLFRFPADGELFHFEKPDPQLLELQERWLKEIVGVENREYPWGLVWNRFNIHSGWHDIAIIFNDCKPSR